MALNEAHLAIRFAGGIETKADSKTVPATKLLALENGVFTKVAAIKKRNGYNALNNAIDGSASQLSGLKKMAARGDELLAFSSTRCYSHQEGVDQWTNVGAVMSVPGTDEPVVRTGSAQTMPDAATNGGVTAYAWEDSRGGVYWTAVDAATGAVHREPTQAESTGISPRCVAVGNLIHIYYAVAASRYIKVIIVNPANPTAAVTPTIMIDDLATDNPVYDVCSTLRTGTPAAIVWAVHPEISAQVKIGYVDVSGVIGTVGTGHPSPYLHLPISAGLAADSPLAVAHQYNDGANGDYLGYACVADGERLVVIFNGGTSAVAIGGTEYTGGAGTADVDSPSSVNRCALALVSGSYYCAFEETAVSDINRRVVTNTGIINGAAGTPATQRSVALATRAFEVNGDVFVYVVHDTTYFNTYFCLRISDHICVDRRCVATALGKPTRLHVSSVQVVDDVATTCLPYKVRLQSSANDQFGESGLRKLELNFASSDTHQAAQLGRGLYMAGGCPQHYDGRQWTEQGFHVGPDTIAAGTPAGGGSMTASTTYLYRFWYEWTDAQGEVHRGPESVGKSVTMAGGQTQVTWVIPTLRLTKKPNVRICVARGLSGDSTRLFRVSSLDPTTSGAAANGYIANTTSSDTVTWIDRMSDATAQTQEPHYTNGGVLSNDAAPLGAIVAGGKNRLFFSDGSEPHTVRYSQQLAETFGVEIAPQLYVPCDPLGGPINGLAVMDDVVYVFKRGAIFGFTGDGPLATGDVSQTGFSSPQLVTADVGCTAPSSIVLTAAGLFFKSAKGIYMLGRDRSVSYVGASVEAYNSQNVRRSTVMPDRNQVVFLTDDGYTLLYDYQFQQWSTFTNHEGYDAIVVNSTYHYLRTDDRVFEETIGTYSDDGVRITLRLETAWIHAWQHLQGLQRFWKLLLLGTWSSAHQLGIQYRTDFEDTWTDAVWLDATGETSSSGWITGEGANVIGVDPITGSVYGEGVYGDGPYGGTPSDVYQWRHGLHVQGQSIQFRFEDFEKAGLAGASFELTEMTIIAGVMKPDTRPFTAARSK